MLLTDLNRQGGIGANALHIKLGAFSFIIDAGLNPKIAGVEAMPTYNEIEDNSLNFIILSHCHLDHLGSLPVLVKRQPQAPILMSFPSQIIAPFMLRNSCNVMLKQRDEFNITEYPLYNHRDIKRVLKKISPLHFGQPRRFNLNGDRLEIALYAAGHVVGAAGIGISHHNRKIFFTGDVHFTPQKTLPAAKFPKENFDTVVIETTRGTTERSIEKSRDKEEQRLIRQIDKVLSNGGSCLIPVFALGRMQEILTLIYQARNKGVLSNSPIYCGGLGMVLANTFDEISRNSGLINFRRKILRDLMVKPLPASLVPGKSPKKPGLFIVSSGMIAGNTPSYLVASSLLASSKNSIYFVGYCDPDTPGGKLLATPTGNNFLFEKLDFLCPVNAQIDKFDLSSHAEREDLLNFALTAKPRTIVLTHGDSEAKDWFEKEINSISNAPKVLKPTPVRTYKL
jgi:Cft2 family RNA processing exonuclease